MWGGAAECEEMTNENGALLVAVAEGARRETPSSPRRNRVRRKGFRF